MNLLILVWDCLIHIIFIIIYYLNIIFTVDSRLFFAIIMNMNDLVRCLTFLVWNFMFVIWLTFVRVNEFFNNLYANFLYHHLIWLHFLAVYSLINWVNFLYFWIALVIILYLIINLVIFYYFIVSYLNFYILIEAADISIKSIYTVLSFLDVKYFQKKLIAMLYDLL